MKILGMIKASLIDYPKKASTVLFIGGCNFRCGYCHNPELVLCGEGAAIRNFTGQNIIMGANESNVEGEIKVEANKQNFISQDDVFEFLNRRKRFLDGVVISGGEPTVHAELPDFISQIKALGYAVKLDTNGTNPDVLEKLIASKQLDYIAMDIKGSLAQYEEICEVQVDTEAIKRSIKLIMSCGINYEFRTTVCREYMTSQNLPELCKMIKGAKKYCLQSFKNPGIILSPNKSYSAYSEVEMKALGEIATAHVKQVIIR